MVTVGICDDEKQQRTMLRRIAESYFQLLGEEYKVDMPKYIKAAARFREQGIL